MGMNQTLLSPEVSELLELLELRQGQVGFSSDTFRKWRKRLGGAVPARRPQLRMELIAVARRMLKYSSTGGTEAVAQLIVLANDLSAPARTQSLGAARRADPLATTLVD